MTEKNKEIIHLKDLKKGDRIGMFIRSKHGSESHDKTMVTFMYVDGLYCRCKIFSNDQDVLLSPEVPLVKVGDHYEIAFDREEDEK